MQASTYRPSIPLFLSTDYAHQPHDHHRSYNPPQSLMPTTTPAKPHQNPHTTCLPQCVSPPSSSFQPSHPPLKHGNVTDSGIGGRPGTAHLVIKGIALSLTGFAIRRVTAVMLSAVNRNNWEESRGCPGEMKIFWWDLKCGADF